MNTQVAVVDMIIKLQAALDNGKLAAGPLIDLSKAFDTINHEMLKKLEAVLEVMHSYGLRVTLLTEPSMLKKWGRRVK